VSRTAETGEPEREDMKKEHRRLWICFSRFVALVFGVVLGPGAVSPEKQRYTTWSDYGGTPDSMQYSALRQINKENVSRIELASARVNDSARVKHFETPGKRIN
jgi:hypothetical protein